MAKNKKMTSSDGQKHLKMTLSDIIVTSSVLLWLEHFYDQYWYQKTNLHVKFELPMMSLKKW